MTDLEGVQIRRAKLDDMEEIEVLLQELIGDPKGVRRKFFIKASLSRHFPLRIMRDFLPKKMVRL
jgi:hypothetical protein